MRADGFTHCLIHLPPRDALYRFWDELTGARWTGYARDVGDLSYVWAKLSGIELEKL